MSTKIGYYSQFKQWISEFLGLYKSDSEEAEALRKAADDIDALIKMWDDMLKKSLTANKALETAKARENKNSAEKDGVVQYSFKEYSEHQKENWKNSKKIVLYENENQYRSFIETSISDKQFNKKIYFGAITKSQAERIKIDTNIDVENYNCSLSANEIRKMFKDHGSEEKESLRGQRALTVTDVVEIPQVLLSPDKISLSLKTYNGKPVINFVKNTDGIMTVSAVVSDKHLDLFVQTAFAGIKKGNLATPIAEQAAINTSETSSGTVSTNSISDSSQKINDKTVNNDDVQFAEKATPEITQKSVDNLRSIGRKNVNDFTAEDIKKAEPFARRMFKNLGTKSTFFRAWFGEWESDDKKNPALVTDIPQNRNYKTDNRFATNEYTKFKIQITENIFGDSLHYSNKDRIYIERLLANIDEVIEKAVLLDTAVSAEGKANKKGSSQFMHSFYSIVEYQGAPFLAKIIVEEYATEGKKRAYNARRIKMSTLSRAQYSQLKAAYRGNYASNVDAVSISDLVGLVKTYDKEFNPKEPSKIVNADGTPKIMYHGSAAQFTVFDKKKAKTSGLYGKGFYFTDSESNANLYGKLYAVYLDVKKPLERGKTTISTEQIKRYLEAIAENEDYSIENYGTYDVYEVLKKIQSRDAFDVIQDINATAIGDFVEAIKLFNEINGTNFDGIITPTEVVVFEPNQIKSATDNIGTFDVNNPDIRYSDKTTETDTDLLRSLLDEEELRSLKEREVIYQSKIKLLSERLKAEKKPSKGKVYEHYISETAAHLLEHYGSEYKKSELVKDLDELYDRMVALPETVKDFAYGIASKVYDGITAKKTVDENAASLLAELKTRRSINTNLILITVYLTYLLKNLLCCDKIYVTFCIKGRISYEKHNKLFI